MDFKPTFIRTMLEQVHLPLQVDIYGTAGFIVIKNSDTTEALYSMFPIHIHKKVGRKSFAFALNHTAILQILFPRNCKIWMSN